MYSIHPNRISDVRPAIPAQSTRLHDHLRTIQKLLGHSDVTTTEIYTHAVGRGGMGVVSPLDLR